MTLPGPVDILLYPGDTLIIAHVLVNPGPTMCHDAVASTGPVGAVDRAQ